MTRLTRALLLASLLLALPRAAAAADPSPAPDPYAGEPWWIRAGLPGRALASVSASGPDLAVTTADGAALVSADGGATFTAAPGAGAGRPAPFAAAEAGGAGDRWLIRDGRVLHATAGAEAAPDPGSPDLGPGAHLLAAPAALPGVVLAVSDAGVVWRREAGGDWSRSAVLLPQTLLGGTPRITALAAFASSPPGSTVVTVYMATDGYSVLASGDAGYSWFRDGPGLPDRVSALTPAPERSAIFAATDDGLWVHHLRVPPSIPQYAAPDLSIRQKGVAAIALVASAGGGAALWLAARRRPRWAR